MRTILPLSAADRDDIKTLAKASGKTVHEYVAALVRNHVAAERKRPKPSLSNVKQSQGTDHGWRNRI
jgi:hypothetical protein